MVQERFLEIIDQGWISTVALIIIAILLTIISQSTAYLIAPLWLTPLFILKTPKSDLLAIKLFLKVEPIFRVRPVIDFLLSKIELLSILLTIAFFTYISIRYLANNEFPQDWLELSFKLIAGIIGGGLMAAFAMFFIIPCVILGYAILIVSISIFIKIIAISSTLVTAFPYTVSRAYTNYRKIILEDNFKRKIGLVNRIGLVMPSYSARNFLEEVSGSSEKIVTELDDGDHRIKFLANILGLFFALVCFACILIPALLPRICVKISALPLGAILLIPGKTLEKARGHHFIKKIANDWKSSLWAFFLICLYASLYALVFSEIFKSQFDWRVAPEFRSLANELIFSNRSYILTLITASLTLVSFLLANLAIRIQVVDFNFEILEYALRLMGFSRVISAVFIVLAVFTTSMSTDFMKNLINIISNSINFL